MSGVSLIIFSDYSALQLSVFRLSYSRCIQKPLFIHLSYVPFLTFAYNTLLARLLFRFEVNSNGPFIFSAFARHSLADDARRRRSLADRVVARRLHGNLLDGQRSITDIPQLDALACFLFGHNIHAYMSTYHVSLVLLELCLNWTCFSLMQLLSLSAHTAGTCISFFSLGLLENQIFESLFSNVFDLLYLLHFSSEN